jgi:uncharacterized membrane protein YphA (DoxX/SURF4 family)
MKTRMNKKTIKATRFILGLAFLIFGLNGFFNFMPIPPMSQSATQFMAALNKTGYFFPMVKGLEALLGALLLLDLFTPLALIMLSPILVGITTLHIFLNPQGLPIAFILHGLHAYLVWGYWIWFRPFTAPKANTI